MSTSVVIAARNAEVTLGACLASLRALEPPALEIIVVDDASIDGTAEIARAGGARVIELEENLGPGLARNIGAEAAGGSLIAFTDADCTVPKDWLAAFHSELDERYCAVTGPYAGASRSSPLTRLMDGFLKFRQRPLPDRIESAITANLAVRRSDFLAVGGFPAYKLPGASMCCFTNEDEELAHLLVRHTGKPVRWLRENGVWHAFRPTWRGYFKQQAKYAEAILISYARFPSLRFATTNYSRGGGIAQVGLLWLALAGFAVAILLAEPLALLAVLPFPAANLPAIAYLSLPARSTRNRLWLAAVSLGFLCWTALAWSKGLLLGSVKAAVGLLSPSFSKDQAWRPRKC